MQLYMCIFFHWDRRSLRGSIGQICQNSPIHGICHWLSRARAVTGWETKLSWARAVTGWETTLGRAWPVTGWETTRPLLFKGIRCPMIKFNLMTYELNVDRFYAQLGVFFYFRYFTWYRDEIWIKLNLMTQDFHVDRFYAQLGAFFLFSLFHLIEG